MNKVISLTITLILIFITSAFAVLTLEVTDPPNKIMRVTYNLTYDEEGLTSAIFPSTGYSFFNGPIEVVSVVETTVGLELKYKVVKVDNGEAQAVEIDFPNPIPKYGRLSIQVVVEGITDNIKKDLSGRYAIAYETSWKEVSFIIPMGHVLVYSNTPVLFDNKKGKKVVKTKGQRIGNELVFKTRPYVWEELYSKVVFEGDLKK